MTPTGASGEPTGRARSSPIATNPSPARISQAGRRCCGFIIILYYGSGKSKILHEHFSEFDGSIDGLGMLKNLQSKPRMALGYSFASAAEGPKERLDEMKKVMEA